ncbi:hypothetical protein [Poseidonocella sp. HB161398]|uniref:hypothetical protein n=1 Tax=Poseidonocella sp. HB161398 TaxID=2320855 RepID=UPI001109F8FF|nr:hypothetical protein [Poseidonocella sp. HB161398]
MVLPLALATSLIPLVADVLPPMVRFLVGDRQADAVKHTAQAAESIANEVSRVIGMPVQTPSQVEEARALLAADPELMVKLRSTLAQLDAELARVELERDRAFLEDVQDARRSQETRGEKRGNIMLISAFVAIVLIVALVTLVPTLNETVVGFVIGIGGMFARNIGSAFDFEFGSSRGSKNKEQVLGTELRKAQQAVVEQAATDRITATTNVVKVTATAVDKLKKQLAGS